MTTSTFDGPYTGSTDRIVVKLGARQCRSLLDWGDPVEDTKIVNAKANTTGSVTVSGKNVKFSSRGQEAVLA